jgi:O-antigen biosynthesis protein
MAASQQQHQHKRTDRDRPSDRNQGLLEAMPEALGPGRWRLRLPRSANSPGSWSEAGWIQLKFLVHGSAGPTSLELHHLGKSVLRRQLIGDEPVELLWPAAWMADSLEVSVEGGSKLKLRQLQLHELQAEMAERRLLLMLQSRYASSPARQEMRVRRELKLDASWPNRQERLMHIFRHFCQSPVCNDLGLHGRLVKRRQAEDQPGLALRASATHGAGPSISVVVPVYRPNPLHLQACIASVRRQSYRHWQLCLVDDHSLDPLTTALLEEAAASDPRIRIGVRSSNGHIAAATNDAIAMATGDYIAFVDNDDMLAPDALAQVADAIVANPRRQLIYSDEDFIAPSGQRINPHHKPDWNLELLRAHNYITHLAVVGTATLRSLGGLRSECDGAQDYDLMLRLSEVLHPEQIHHIPRVLYHWRISPSSTASGGEAKTYTVDAGQRALHDHLKRCDLQARVESLDRPNFYRLRWPLPDPAPTVSIIIPTKNGLGVLRPCVESLQCSTYPGTIEVLVVDNNSDDPATLTYLAALTSPTGESQWGHNPRIRHRVILYSGRFNYAAINNHAVEQCTGEVVVLLNNDTAVISPDWLEELVSQASRPEVGCVGPKLLYGDGTLQHAGVITGIGGSAGHAFKGEPGSWRGYFNRAMVSQEMSAVTAACLAIRRQTYLDVGGLDAGTFPVAFNDIDFCLRVRAAGYHNIFTPHVQLHHFESKSRGYEDTPVKALRFKRDREWLRHRWLPELLQDPAYNPNLTRHREDFQLAGVGED